MFGKARDLHHVTSRAGLPWQLHFGVLCVMEHMLEHPCIIRRHQHAMCGAAIASPSRQQGSRLGPIGRTFYSAAACFLVLQLHQTAVCAGGIRPVMCNVAVQAPHAESQCRSHGSGSCLAKSGSHAEHGAAGCM